MERACVGEPSGNFAMKKSRGELYDMGAAPDRKRPAKHSPALKSTVSPASVSLHLCLTPPRMCVTVIKNKKVN